MESLEEKKEIVLVHPRESNSIEKTVKEKLKVVRAKKGEKYDPRGVAFSEKCVEAMNLSNEKKENKNYEIQSYFELEEQRANKLKIIIYVKHRSLST